MVSLRRKCYRFAVPLLLGCLAAPVAAVGQDFWSRKPYHDWSAEETRRLLEESPWATTLTLTSLSRAGVEGEANPNVTYNLQIRSAWPIREAQVRSVQLKSHYDTMSVDQKAAFDAKAEKYLAVAFPDRVVISITFQSNVLTLQNSLRSYWASQNLAQLSMSVFLDTRTEQLKLMSYAFKDDTFEFTFPRPKQLRSDEKISVRFTSPPGNSFPWQRVLQSFSLKKMLVNGEPVL